MKVFLVIFFLVGDYPQIVEGFYPRQTLDMEECMKWKTLTEVSLNNMSEMDDVIPEFYVVCTTTEHFPEQWDKARDYFNP